MNVDKEKEEIRAFFRAEYTDTLTTNRLVSANKVVEHIISELERYSMSAGEADQFKNEAIAARLALGMNEDSETVSPNDIKEAIFSIKSDLDEADRRAGYAERTKQGLQESDWASQKWLNDAKVQAGYDISVSFDVVWSETLSKAQAT